MPLYLSKVLQAREHAPTPCSSVVFSLDLHLNPLKSLGVRQMCNKMKKPCGEVIKTPTWTTFAAT